MSLWSDRPPWQAKRAEQQQKAERIGALVDAYRSGALSYSRLADRIDEVLNGEFDRIVRVGEVPKPEIKS
jgi:hypothetical protein